MAGVNKSDHKQEDLSGWILPDGTWLPVDEWWHIAALYDLRDSGYTALLSLRSESILLGGDEALIRSHAADLGFVKVSRRLLDAYSMNQAQLKTLQEQLIYCDLEAEFGILNGDKGVVRTISVARLLKLRNPLLLWNREATEPGEGN